MTPDSASPRRAPRLGTADGTNTAAFTATDWALLMSVAAIWGSSFLWIAIALESFEPSSVAFLRVALGALSLLAVPSARKAVGRDAWPAIAVIAVAGNAGPALLVAIAQQHVDSSVAGMTNAATPLAVLVVSMALLRRSPGSRQVAGLLLGFVGVGLMIAPSLIGADAQPTGIALLLLAVAGYGISNNLVVPLQQTHGAPAIILRALVFGTVVLAPWGGAELVGSEPSASSVAAVVILGVLGTGLARALSASLAGRTGASRSSLITYFVPIVAIALGVVVRNESVGGFELAGTALVLGAAYLITRAQKRP